MATTLEINEGVPASWPEVMAHLETASLDAPDADTAVTWQRIEAWIRFRYAVRPVTYIIQGPGVWTSPLTPFTASSVEMWITDEWQQASPRPSPSGGFVFDGEGPFKVTGTAGDDSEPPEAVKEAWRRLHEYNRGIAYNFRSEAALIEAEGSRTVTGWTGKAIHLSGAADLLRPYRRLAA